MKKLSTAVAVVAVSSGLLLGVGGGMASANVSAATFSTVAAKGSSSEEDRACIDTAKADLKSAKREAQDERKRSRLAAKQEYRVAIAPFKRTRDIALAAASTPGERAAAIAQYRADRAPYKATFKSAKRAADAGRKTAVRDAKADFDAAKDACG